MNTAFQNLTPNARVIELDQKQPERKNIGFATYLKNVVSQKRIDTGRLQIQQNAAVLNQVQTTYNVPQEVITALWGIETSYGQNTGNYDLVQALATLAWEGRREAFFKNELMEALFILQGNHISRSDFKGSWAGAMGQNQFMPSSWKKFAVDYDGNGHKNIWTDRSDVFASSANYLASNGWDYRVKWGWAVTVPDHISAKDQTKPFPEWLKMGVKFKGSIPDIEAHTPLKLIVPDGGEGRAYLVSKNYDVILTWNRSTYFALSVGLLSDFIAQRPREDLNS